jgi:hypothetical protein
MEAPAPILQRRQQWKQLKSSMPLLARRGLGSRTRMSFLLISHVSHPIVHTLDAVKDAEWDKAPVWLKPIAQILGIQYSGKKCSRIYKNRIGADKECENRLSADHPSSCKGCDMSRWSGVKCAHTGVKNCIIPSSCVRSPSCTWCTSIQNPKPKSKRTPKQGADRARQARKQK